MRFKLIITLIEDNKTDLVLKAAREAGATGSTVINQARGEGIKKSRTFFGLNLEIQRDVVLLLVEEHLSRHILERIAEVGGSMKNQVPASHFKLTYRMLLASAIRSKSLLAGWRKNYERYKTSTSA